MKWKYTVKKNKNVPSLVFKNINKIDRTLERMIEKNGKKL